MPQIKLNHIISFSSEDSNHPASNLLSNDIENKRWLCQNKGETSCSVVLQLERSSKITSIRIGNYHSAIVEVLVGRSETPDSPFEVILCASSFMTPGDSRNSTNISRIRTFDNTILSAGVKDNNWDRIRVVCTQPYNKHVQYGLSFIHVFNSSDNNKIQTKAPETTLGKFKLKDPSSDEDDVATSFKPGEIFSKFKNKTPNTDAQIRQASSPYGIKDNTKLVKLPKPEKKTQSISKISQDVQSTSRKRDEIFYNSDDDSKNDKIDKIMERDKKEKEKKAETEQQKNPPKKTAFQKASSSHSKIDNFETKTPKITSKESPQTVSKRSRDPDVEKDEKINKRKRTDRENSTISLSYARGAGCLKGVVFVLSGYVNPKRSNLRDSAISLGARYNPDWNPMCTHLICAFPNTPKYDQVRQINSKAIIVNAEWIEDCVKEQAHLPWQYYALDPKLKVARPANDQVKIPSSDSDTDVDTEDEIEKVMKQQQIDDLKNNKKDDSDATDIDESLLPDDNIHSPYSKATDEEDNKPPNGESVDFLPDLFSGIKFHVDSSLGTKYDIEEIKRYINAFGGDITDEWPGKNIDVLITIDNSMRVDKPKKCELLRPEWVWKCNDTRSLYDFRNYRLNV